MILMNTSQSRHYAIESENNCVLVLRGEVSQELITQNLPALALILFALAWLHHTAPSLGVTPLRVETIHSDFAQSTLVHGVLKGSCL